MSKRKRYMPDAPTSGWLLLRRRLFQQRQQLGTRAERRKAKFAAAKVLEKQRRHAPKPAPIISTMHTWLTKKGWKK